MSNFIFLKKNNNNLFKIISEAEKLFRDEYFEQTVVQSRRFAENLCKELLQEKVSQDDTFDSMINKIKDNSFGNIRMKEFSDDLYFLKKHGNNSAHSSSAEKNGKIALECLERAFEVAIFFSNIKNGYNKKLDNAVFSEELLMTGKKTSKKELKEIYSEKLKQTREKKPALKSTKVKKSTKTKKAPKKKSKKKNNLNAILIFLLIILVLIGYYILTVII